MDGITQVVSLDSITGPGFETELLPDELMNIVQNGGYKLILANGRYKSGSDALNAQVDEPSASSRRQTPRASSPARVP